MSLRAPAPIRLRAECRGTAGRPSRFRTKLSASIRSGAVSTSVPSRSKTMVGAEAMVKRYRSPRDHARWHRRFRRSGMGTTMRDFDGKTAFVTGGASGIGLAMARAFLDLGMKVMLADVEDA